MGPDIHKAFPVAIAALYHPIHVKAALRIEEPIQWKGSALATLWKGKGSTTVIDNHRELHIAPTDGKQYEASIRSNLIKPLAGGAGEFQYGAGLAGSSCDMAHLHITETLAYGMQKNLSTAVAFVDLVSAFASMRRCLAVPGDDASDQCWKQHLRTKCL